MALGSCERLWPKGIGITVTFIGGCLDPDTPKGSSFKTGGPDCHRILANTIIDNCDTEQKRGGSLISSVCNPIDIVGFNVSY